MCIMNYVGSPHAAHRVDTWVSRALFVMLKYSLLTYSLLPYSLLTYRLLKPCSNTA